MVYVTVGSVRRVQFEKARGLVPDNFQLGSKF